ncbi:hypothetical protein AWH62_09450 [Maricaulis sp. W15]|uniref:Uncharacterized protein n=1 Tax=Maricaulis maris TaxID=74318 RepID=A0A495DLD0_9PROT|nr:MULTISPECIES: hypothetical protein [Maricaulis]OLF73157.1 hypothetical protein AWH62_09450 [Maricaulis sp. W15]RKR03107.1 hypothetical protein C7435_1055 [Maricaulis maris]
MSTPETPTPDTPQPEGPKKPNRGFMIMMAVLGLAFGLPTVYSGGVMVGQAFGTGEFPAIGFIIQLSLGLMLAGFGLAAMLAVVKSFAGKSDGQG